MSCIEYYSFPQNQVYQGTCKYDLMIDMVLELRLP